MSTSLLLGVHRLRCCLRGLEIVTVAQVKDHYFDATRVATSFNPAIDPHGRTSNVNSTVTSGLLCPFIRNRSAKGSVSIDRMKADMRTHGREVSEE